MTPNKEDYLKVIYEAGGEHATVPNKVIAERLGVAPASVSEMVARLSEQGLVRYEAYKGTSLTDEGLVSCLAVVRSHRLWEVFLIRHLHYTWSEAHEDAHLLEHAAPRRMVDRLDQFLNHPAYCPHGAAIPGAQTEARALRPLAGLEEGDTAVIAKVTEEKALMDYLQARGVAIGATVRVVQIEPYEGPYHLEIGGEALSISYKAAGQIDVEQIIKRE